MDVSGKFRFLLFQMPNSSQKAQAYGRAAGAQDPQKSECSERGLENSIDRKL